MSFFLVQGDSLNWREGIPESCQRRKLPQTISKVNGCFKSLGRDLKTWPSSCKQYSVAPGHSSAYRPALTHEQAFLDFSKDASYLSGSCCLKQGWPQRLLKRLRKPRTRRREAGTIICLGAVFVPLGLEKTNSEVVFRDLIKGEGLFPHSLLSQHC